MHAVAAEAASTHRLRPADAVGASLIMSMLSDSVQAVAAEAASTHWAVGGVTDSIHAGRPDWPMQIRQTNQHTPKVLSHALLAAAVYLCGHGGKERERSS